MAFPGGARCFSIEKPLTAPSLPLRYIEGAEPEKPHTKFEKIAFNIFDTKKNRLKF